MPPPIESVRVVAPATLTEGYSFEAQVDGKIFEVVVPSGGVKEGQEFEVPYPTWDNSDDDDDDDDEEQQQYNNKDKKLANDDDDDDNDSTTPQLTKGGEWRVGLLSCCDVVTQATCWMSCLCMPVFVAQLLTRMKLSWRGQEASPDEVSMTFNRIVMSYVCVLFVAAWLVPIGGVILIVIFTLYMLYIAVSARKVMRKKFDIPASPLLGEVMEDYCCLFFCPCCATIQMARHTHDDHEYPGYCCTTDGLELGAPRVV